MTADVTDQQKSGSGRKRQYTEDELALFERYQERRRAKRPIECSGKAMCWVVMGPPAWRQIPGKTGECTGCGGMPQEPIYGGRG